MEFNIFSGNNPGGSQAFDDGWMESTNVFVNNYWSDWTGPDANKDGIVDSPYSIDGMAGNQDAFPLTLAEILPSTTTTTSVTPSWTALLLILSLGVIIVWRQGIKKS